MKKVLCTSLLIVLWGALLLGQNNYLLKPDRVFDGESMQPGWVVFVKGERIHAVGPANTIPLEAGTKVLDLPGTTLLPGLIEGHSRLLLHPYNETSWSDQVLKETITERILRASQHAEATLKAGFTTVRDQGSEGADYSDVGLKAAIEKGIIIGPRMLVAGRAIVATGSYGPKGFANHVEVPLGAEEADGYNDLIRVVRSQIGNGADLIKVYADYRWGPNGEAMPTFSIEELKLIVETAKSSGRDVVAHAATAEGMRRATLAGVKTIEHGDGGTKEVFELMAKNGVALCPAISAGEAIAQYKGWKKGVETDPPRVMQKRKSMALALDAGVIIVAGSDVGVFPHGENIRELELMESYGMNAMNILRSATSVGARMFNMQDSIGSIKVGMLADLILVKGNPGANISNLRNVQLVMKGGEIFYQSKQP